MAVALIVAILLSGLVAITLSPMICARLLHGGSERKTAISSASTAPLTRFAPRYQRVLEWMMGRKPLALFIWGSLPGGNHCAFYHHPERLFSRSVTAARSTG